MTLHRGVSYTLDSVGIGPYRAELVDVNAIEADVVDSFRVWTRQAIDREDIYYFSIYEHCSVVGQVFLHDIVPKHEDCLVGYHIFGAQHRGRGIGTTALSLLQRFTAEQTRLNHLVVITSRGNVASQRIAQKCGFVYDGPSREDPIDGMSFRWNVPNAE